MHNKKMFGYMLFTAFSLCVFVGLFIHYKKSEKSFLSVAQKIYAVMEKYRVDYDIDAHSMDSNVDVAPQKVNGVDQCIQNIIYFVGQQKPIEMLLVGFPFKSGNTEKKVNGYLPDMAERKSLEYLQQILNDIKKVYKPGAHVLIFCDGIPFAEFFGIPLKHVIDYEQALQRLNFDLSDITINTSSDVMKKFGLSSVQDIIKLIDTYEPTDAQFRADMTTIPEVALKRFALELDHAQGKLLVERYTLTEIVTCLLAREMRLRSFIMNQFPSPNYFRLTVHLSPDVSKKFGIKLSPASDITPYHGVMTQDNDGAWSIKFKKDIDQTRYEYKTVLVNGIECGYYQQKKIES